MSKTIGTCPKQLGLVQIVLDIYLVSKVPIIILHFLDDDGSKFCWSIDVSSGLSKKSAISCSSVFLIKKKTFQIYCVLIRFWSFCGK